RWVGSSAVVELPTCLSLQGLETRLPGTVCKLPQQFVGLIAASRLAQVLSTIPEQLSIGWFSSECGGKGLVGQGQLALSLHCLSQLGPGRRLVGTQPDWRCQVVPRQLSPAQPSQDTRRLPACTSLLAVQATPAVRGTHDLGDEISGRLDL